MIIELTIPTDGRAEFVRWCDANQIPINADEEDAHGNRRFRVVAALHSKATLVAAKYFGSDRH